MHQKLEESEAARVDFGANMSDLPASLSLLVTNPTFVFLSLAGASEGEYFAKLCYLRFLITYYKNVTFHKGDQISHKLFSFVS